MPYVNTAQRVRDEAIGVDKDSGLVHRVKATAANEHDVNMVPEPMTKVEGVMYGDSGYVGVEKRKEAVTRNTNLRHTSPASLPGGSPAASSAPSDTNLPRKSV